VANYNGTVPVITYTASDGNGGAVTGTLTIVVTPVNDAPVAAPNTNTVNEDTNATGNVLTDDTDPESNTLSITQLSAVVNGVTINFAPDQSTTLSGIGTIVVAANGDYTFTPNANWNGTVPTITYSVSDGNGGTASSTLAITVTPVNDPPLATDDVFSVTGPLTVSGNIITNIIEGSAKDINLRITSTDYIENLIKGNTFYVSFGNLQTNDISLDVLNSMGNRVAFKNKLVNQRTPQKIDIPNLVTGVYYIKIYANNKVYVQRVFITN
jgi:CshA-type fibril repeat protein